MNRLDPANRLDWLDRIDRLDRMRRMRRLAQVDRASEPIYARLVAEWQAQGRAVPEPDGLRATVPGPAPATRSVRGRA
ncbi:hypothetical protein [Streptomyces sp. NPDC046759]|uniref:hypothetical protein n=1 Tax=Streptomyces sp. NPDC046759 TaxID=3155019 RepID=UPI00340A403B